MGKKCGENCKCSHNNHICTCECWLKLVDKYDIKDEDYKTWQDLHLKKMDCGCESCLCGYYSDYYDVCQKVNKKSGSHVRYPVKYDKLEDDPYHIQFLKDFELEEKKYYESIKKCPTLQ